MHALPGQNTYKMSKEQISQGAQDRRVRFGMLSFHGSATQSSTLARSRWRLPYCIDGAAHGHAGLLPNDSSLQRGLSKFESCNTAN